MRQLIIDELAGWPIGGGFYTQQVSSRDAAEMADAILGALSELREPLAKALDESLCAQCYVHRGFDGHVNLVDGDVDTVEIADDVIEALRG